MLRLCWDTGFVTTTIASIFFGVFPSLAHVTIATSFSNCRLTKDWLLYGSSSQLATAISHYFCMGVSCLQLRFHMKGERTPQVHLCDGESEFESCICLIVGKVSSHSSIAAESECRTCHTISVTVSKAQLREILRNKPTE